MKFPWTKKTGPTLDDNIDAVNLEMSKHIVGTAEYTLVLNELERLTKLKTINKSFGVSPDTAALIAANLAGLIIVLNFERIGVVTSKAFGLVMKIMR